MLPMLPQDKANHMVYGTAIYILGALIHPDLGLILTVIAALAKDVVHDAIQGRGTFDPWDIYATCVLPILIWCLQGFLPKGIFPDF